MLRGSGIATKMTSIKMPTTRAIYFSIGSHGRKIYVNPDKATIASVELAGALLLETMG